MSLIQSSWLKNTTNRLHLYIHCLEKKKKHMCQGLAAFNLSYLRLNQLNHNKGVSIHCRHLNDYLVGLTGKVTLALAQREKTKIAREIGVTTATSSAQQLTFSSCISAAILSASTGRNPRSLLLCSVSTTVMPATLAANTWRGAQEHRTSK